MGRIIITKQGEIHIGSAAVGSLGQGHKSCANQLDEVVLEGDWGALPQTFLLYCVNIDAGRCNMYCVDHKRDEVFDSPDLTIFFSQGL